MSRRKVERGVVPYNRNLHEIVREKSDREVWHQRGYLPHRSEVGLMQFVTFRLADSLPAEISVDVGAVGMARKNRNGFEQLLDRGMGSCDLRDPRVAGMLEDAIRHFHGERYDLRAWCVMPNHVHVLLKQMADLGAIVRSWKSFTARRANQVMVREGTFWARDYWDTFMRNDEQESQVVKYIEENPLKAGLVKEQREYRWSSARLRDDFGRLAL